MKRCLCLLWAASAWLPAADIGRAPLLFREDWRAGPPALPLTQRDVTHPGLRLGVHGLGPPLLKKSFHDARDWDPHYVWSGLAQAPWAVSLALADGGEMDLTGTATIRWRSRQSGFRALRAVVELAEGGWLVSEESVPASSQWRISEFAFEGTRWRQLDIATITEGPWVAEPDLARVRSVGFTDLMRGGRSRACSRVDWIEVYGQRVPTGPVQLFILSGQSNMVGWGNSQELDSVSRFGHDRRLVMFEEGAWRPLRPHRPPTAAQRDRWGLAEHTFGPEIGFARALAEAWPNRRIGIVKQAVGGTGIMAWAPQWNEADADITGDASKGPLYQKLLSKAIASQQAQEVELRGIVWWQGGKDMRDPRAAARYADNLKQLVAALRRDLGMPELPFLIGTYRQGDMPDDLEEIEPEAPPVIPGRPGALQVLRAQTDAPQHIPHSATVILRDLPTYPHNVHANTEGLLVAGRRFAATFLERFAKPE